MAWTTPRTWVTGETVTAAQMNAHIRDNFRETSPFTVTTAGDLSYADAANSMNSRVGIGAQGTILVSTGSAPIWRVPAEDLNYSDAATTGTITSTSYQSTNFAGNDYPDVTVTTGTEALVIVGCHDASNSTAGARVLITFSVSGATTIVAHAAQGAQGASNASDDEVSLTAVRLVPLTAGSNVFQMEARVTAGTGTIVRPRIQVIPF